MFLCRDVISIIMSFIPKYTLIDWVKKYERKLDWEYLSQNPRAIDMIRNILTNDEGLSLEYLSEKDLRFLCIVKGIKSGRNKENLKKRLEKLGGIKRKDPIRWEHISENPEAKDILKKYPEKINWSYLSANPAVWAIDLLRKNPNMIDWHKLSINPSAIELLKENPNMIDWNKLALNPSEEAIKLMENAPLNQSDIIWLLSGNPTKGALQILRDNPSMISWTWLSSNPSSEAVEMLKDSPYKIIWSNLSINSNPEAIKMLRENFNRIDWYNLSYNPSAMDLLIENSGKIFWANLAENPSIFSVNDIRPFEHVFTKFI